MAIFVKLSLYHSSKNGRFCHELMFSKIENAFKLVIFCWKNQRLLESNGFSLKESSIIVWKCLKINLTGVYKSSSLILSFSMAESFVFGVFLFVFSFVYLWVEVDFIPDRTVHVVSTPLGCILRLGVRSNSTHKQTHTQMKTQIWSF